MAIVGNTIARAEVSRQHSPGSDGGTRLGSWLVDDAISCSMWACLGCYVRSFGHLWRIAVGLKRQ